MAMDGLLVHALAHELQACVGGRINKIYQPTERDLILQIRALGQNYKLLLSANPTYPRVHDTKEQFMNPKDAPMFCMLMRKHCESGIIQSIEQVGMERILRIRLKQRDELGDESFKTIVIEIMGRHSNIILLDEATNTIVDGINHITPSISSYRIVMPGSTYTDPPEQHKSNPLEVTKDAFLSLIQFDEPIESQLIQHFSGISPLAAREITYRYETSDVSSSAEDKLWQAFTGIMQAIQTNHFTPNIAEETATGKLYFAVYALTHVTGPVQTFDSLSNCLEQYYGDKAGRDMVKQKTSDLIRFLQNEINKNRKKLIKLEETLEEAKDADRFRIMGELLTASLYSIQKGDKQVEVVNYYDENQQTINIELDPHLTPSENAQRYFKKYTKSKTSLLHVDEQMGQAHEEIRYLEELLGQLHAASLRDIEEIREELSEGGYVRQRGAKSRKAKKADKPQLACYTSSEGIPIYVGKNNKQNEYLTCRLAHTADTWLHTKDIPGSHVVIRESNYGEQTLHEAAMLAGYFSQARESASVPVDYTQIRYVHKPNGAKPGYVIYTNQKTLFVTPDEQQIKQWTVTIK
ncbi:Rqc2 family fibronectin-binding protein [Paenibacillus sp. KN14-4R]|uniref:Rqc2 family fibronectin-binding protein n=1 Tax=Paenibacillus sp. KN14-4R TaxID=3445773 RepID=UPI003F9FE18A